MQRILLAVMLAGSGLAGCATHRAPLPVTGDHEFDAIWDAAYNVLTEYRFTVDRNDPRAGVLTTYPMVGRQWFEVWRKDAPTARMAAMNSLHKIWLIATVTVGKVEPAAQAEGRLTKYRVGVQVDLRRSTRPTYQVSSTAGAFDIFRGRKDTARDTAMYEGPDAKGGAAESIGRYPTLEAEMTRKILARAAKGLTIYRPER